jgi:MFS family permease
MTTATSSQAPARRGPFQAFSALRNRDYRFYWFGLLSAVMGLQILWVGQAWLVYDMTHSPLYLGLVGFSQAVPTILLNMVGGVVADRVDRRRLLIFTQSCNALTVLVLAVLVATGLIEVWHLIVAAFLTGAIGAFDQPARIAFAPQLVPKEELVNAVAMQNMIWQGTRIIGPAIGGILISLVGIQACFFVTSVAVGGMVVLIASIRRPHVRREQQPGKHMGHDLLEGLAFIRSNGVVAAIIGMTFVNSLFGLSHEVLFPVFARDIFDVGSEAYGLLFGVSGAGAFLGSIAVASLSHYAWKGKLLLPGAIAFGLSLVAFSLSPFFLVALAIQFVAGFVNSFYMTTGSASVQLIVPNELRGRVMGVYSLTWSMLPLGGMVMGSLAAATSAPSAVAVGGFIVAGMAIAAGMAVPQLRNISTARLSAVAA